jgi:hypothetical protein
MPSLHLCHPHESGDLFIGERLPAVRRRAVVASEAKQSTFRVKRKPARGQESFCLGGRRLVALTDSSQLPAVRRKNLHFYVMPHLMRHLI